MNARLKEYKKGQVVRLWDVFVLGPAMVYIGTRGKMGPVGQALLTTAGILTISYNLRNYMKNKAQLKKRKL